jgi:hypothetical protein
MIKIQKKYFLLDLKGFYATLFISVQWMQIIFRIDFVLSV